MIEWSTIVIAIAGSISIGEIINLFTIREHKKGMKIENKEKEDNRWEKLADQQADQISQLNETVQKKDARIIELEDRCTALREQLDEANTNLAKSTLLRCSCLNCTSRRPPFGYTELSPEEIVAEKKAGNIE